MVTFVYVTSRGMAMETKEKLYPIAEAVELETGRKVHYTTCFKWWKTGAQGVRLETVVLGGRRLTTLAAIRKFIEAATAADSASRSGAQL